MCRFGERKTRTQRKWLKDDNQQLKLVTHGSCWVLLFTSSALFSLTQGSYPFSETNFQDLSRTQIDFTRAHIDPYTPKILMLFLLMYCLPFTSYFLVEFSRFPELSRASGLFPGLSSPGKCPNKIPFQVFKDPYEPCNRKYHAPSSVKGAMSWLNGLKS